VRVTDAPHKQDLLVLFVVTTCKGGRRPPFDPPDVPLFAASGTCRRFHTSGGAPVTANDNALTAARRSGSQKRRRNRHIDVCCDEAEFVIIDHKARTAGMSLASYLRNCALGSPGPRARRAPPVNAEVLAHAVAALNKVGSNLNQLARIMNSGGAIGSAKNAFAALADTRTAVTRILEIVGRRSSNDRQGHDAQ